MHIFRWPFFLWLFSSALFQLSGVFREGVLPLRRANLHIPRLPGPGRLDFFLFSFLNSSRFLTFLSFLDRWRWRGLHRQPEMMFIPWRRLAQCSS